MNEEKDHHIPQPELPDSWWYKVYAAVILNTIIVITGLFVLTEYFSN